MDRKEMEKQAAADVKAAVFFVQYVTKALGRKQYEYRAVAGFQVPEGPVLVSRKLKSRDRDQLEQLVKQVKASRLTFRIDDSIDRATSSTDSEPRLVYELKGAEPKE